MKASQSLISQVQALEEGLYQLSHDLVTPIQIVRMSASLVKRTLPDLITAYHQVEAQEFDLPKIEASELKNSEQSLSTIENQAERLLDLLNTISPKKEQSLDMQVYAISEIATQVVKDIQCTLDEQTQRKIHLDFTQDFKITAHKASIESVIVNLLNNALYAILKAKRGEIWIEAKHTATCYQLCIKDTGMGIPEPLVPLIFEFGYTSKPSGVGSGIGLNSCRTVMQQLNGEITCETKAGEYTTFILTFPLMTP